MLPMGFLVERFGKVGMKEFLAGMLAREMPTEQVATFFQDAIDTATANPDKTWGEFLKERPDAAYQTALGVLVQSSILGAASNVSRRFSKSMDDAQQAEDSGAALEQQDPDPRRADGARVRGPGG
jgi:hypothetical protein